MNHNRQSTEGWSIDNVLLDLSGGVLSVAQVLVSCRVLNDWTSVTGDCGWCVRWGGVLGWGG
jgi:cystinosin